MSETRAHEMWLFTVLSIALAEVLHLVHRESSLENHYQLWEETEASITAQVEVVPQKAARGISRTTRRRDGNCLPNQILDQKREIGPYIAHQ